MRSRMFSSSPRRAASQNLLGEGIGQTKIHLIGNLMIDTLYRELPRARDSACPGAVRVEERRFGLVTLHRPSNVDDPRVLAGVY